MAVPRSRLRLAAAGFLGLIPLAGCGGGGVSAGPSGPSAPPVPAPPASPGSWVPPVGIPAPPFGIAEVAGPATSAVAEGDTLPSRILPGAVIEIQGTYARSHTGGGGIACAGTRLEPAFIRGAAGATVTGEWEIGGSYCIVEKLRFQGPGAAVVAPADHVALRDVEVEGTPDGGGLGILTASSANASDIVVLRALVHDNGDWKADFDQDVHGIGVYRSSDATGTLSNLWILDSEFHHNSGDGVQINGNRQGAERLHHVYVGRNVAHHNKQTGFWTKQASDVVFSQNEAYAHRPSDSSPGAGLGGQYAPERVWFLYNRVHDSDVGFRMASDSGFGDGRSHYYVGNAVWGIHASGTFNPDTGWSEACFSLVGGTSRHVVGNTCHDADSGVRTPGGALSVAQNVFAGIVPEGAHVFQEGRGAVELRRNLTDEAPRFVGTPGCVGCVVGPPRFADPKAGDFTPLPGSAAIDAGGPEEAVYALFRATYGLDVRNARPAGAAWDIGAVEARTGSSASR